MLLAVALLAILAAAAIPDSGPADQIALDLATAEVVGALVFARAEALRTANPYGVRFRTTLNKIEVFRLDISGTPSEIYDVRHPLDKKIYDIDLESFPYTAGATAAADFRYAAASAPSLAVAFDARGEPIAANDLDPLFTDGSVLVSHRGLTRTVTVATLTGRITAP